MSQSNPYESPAASTPAVQRRTFTLKRVDVLSVGIMVGVLYAILGLFVGGIFSLFSLIGIAAQENAVAAGLVGGVLSVIIMPLMYGVMGFIGGLIMGVIYNVCASLVGGIKFDLE